MKDNDITRLLEAVHCDRRVRLEQLPVVSKYILDDQHLKFQQKDVANVLAGGDSGQLSAKILYVMGLQNGVESCAELFSRLLFTAANEKELQNFLSFALTLSPIFPNVVTLGVRHLVSNIRHLTIEVQKEEEEARSLVNNRSSKSSSHFSVDTRWLSNLLALISWQKHAPENSLLNCLGLNLADIRGDLQVGLFDWAFSYLDQLDRGNGWDRLSSNVFVCFLDLLKMVSPKLQLQIRDCNRLIVQFSALVVLLLKLVKKENFGSSLDGVDMVCHCYAIAGLFFASQQSVDKSLLAKSLLDDIFANSAAVFGTKKILSNIGNEITSGKFSPSLLSEYDSDEFSFLKALRSSSTNSKTAHAFAHTGQLRKCDRGASEDAQEEAEMLRVFLFTNMIEIICMKYDNQTLSLKQCECLGKKLVEQFCLDGLTSGFGWNDWEWEREQLSCYIEISKKMEETPFISNFLLILASSRSGIWFAMPLLRARFVHLLSGLETTILKDERVCRKTLDMIAFLFSVFVTADFITETLVSTFDVLCCSTNYEAYVVMMSLWKLIESKWPVSGNMPTDLPLTDALLLKGVRGAQFVEVVMLVGQYHISEAKPSFANLVNMYCNFAS